jgi:hypothetical protein
VVLVSRIGIEVELSPLKVLIPRDLHLGNPTFENIQSGQEVEFKVVGSQFKQGDQDIVVVATLVGQTDEENKEGSEIPEVAAIPSSQSGSGEIMRVVVMPTEEKPKKRKLKRAEDV